MRRLADIIVAHSGNLIDKWEQYPGIYEGELAGFVAADRPVSLLEIGVQNGGSLQVWREYLPKGSRIVGIDIDPRCEILTFSEDTQVHVADGTDRAVLDTLLGDAMFDIVIDDGSHRSDHIVSTYKALFHRVKGGGKFFIEDLHASYWASHGGGFRSGESAMEFLKGLVDGLNCDHFRDTGNAQRDELDHLRDFGHAVARMTFYDSVAVIEFLETPRPTPYRRLVGGGETPVEPLASWVADRARLDASTMLVGRTTARHIDRVLLGRIDELTAEARSRDALIAENKALRAEIKTLEDGPAWRIRNPFRRRKPRGRARV